MSNWKVHVIVGYLVALLGYFLGALFGIFAHSEKNMLVFLPFVFIIAQLPDIDSPNSLIHTFFIGIGGVFIMFLLLFSIVYSNYLYLFIVILVVIFMFLLTLLKHRNKMHTILTGIFILSPILILSWKFYILSLLVYISHLVIDKDIKIW